MRIVLWAMVLATPVLQFSGCSLIGFGIGSVRDSMGPEETAATLFPLDNLAKKELSILCRDGTVIWGRFHSLLPVSGEAYKQTYAAARERIFQSQGLLLPGIGEKVSLLEEGTKSTEIEFLGFNSRGTKIRVAETGRLVNLKSGIDWTIEDRQGRAFSSRDALSLALEGKLPFSDEIIVNTIIGTRIVALNSIKAISYRVQRNEKWNWFFVGLGVDIFMFVVYPIYWFLLFGAEL